MFYLVKELVGARAAIYGRERAVLRRALALAHLAACPGDAAICVIVSAVRRVAKIAQYVPEGRACAH
jgi:hypothetical protein